MCHGSDCSEESKDGFQCEVQAQATMTSRVRWYESYSVERPRTNDQLTCLDGSVPHEIQMDCDLEMLSLQVS